MSISLIPADSRFRRFVCTGGETSFPVTFPFFAAADLVVARERGGTEVVLTLGPDYAVTGAGNPAGGTVTLAAAALAGDVVAIIGDQPVSRSSDWTDGQALTARALNAENARHVIVQQQLERDATRSLGLSLTDPATSLVLPPQAVRANRVLGFDAAGAVVAVVPNAGSLVITPFAETLLDDTTAAAARATLGAAATADLAARLPRDGSAPMTAALRVAAGAAGGIRIEGDDDTRIVQSAADTLRIETGGAARLTVGTTDITAAVPVTVPAPTAGGHAATRTFVEQMALRGMTARIDTPSGTAFDVTGIPSWATELTVMFWGVRWSGTTNNALMLFGTSTGMATTGYSSISQGAGVSGFMSAVHFVIPVIGAGDGLSGLYTFRLADAATNTWVGSGTIKPSGANTTIVAGRVALPGALTQLRLQAGGALTFIGGSFSVEWRQ